MKTLKSITAVACCAALFLIMGCEKELKPSKPAPAVTPELKTQQCDPWRSVTGYVDLIDELNGFALCDARTCTGRSVFSTASTSQLEMAPMLIYIIPDNYSVSPTEQNDIMNTALAWATAHKPFGYFVSQIQFGYQVIGIGPPSEACISILVTYRKCTGGGGEED